MRKVTALLLAFTIFTVSSLPMVAEAATCSMPAHLIAQQQADAFAPPTATEHRQHDTVFDGDRQSCRMECGCGCHRSVDALPHLLAPSSLNTGGLVMPVVRLYAPSQPVASFHGRLHSLSTPPPIVS